MSDSRKKFGLVGYPLGHSFSPLIHNSAFQLTGIDYEYSLIEVPPDGIDAFLQQPPNDLCGFNITIPHKERIIDALDTKDKVVGTTGCCNTVKIESGRFHGFNTDVAGIEYTLNMLIGDTKIRRALIFGAGGAAKAAAWTLAERFRLNQIDIICRNPNNSIIAGFDFLQSENIRFLPSASLECDNALNRADLVINCTPLGMMPETKSSPLKDGVKLKTRQLIFDMVYNPPVTKLMKQAEEAGVRTIGGLDMLIVQAAEAFKIFTGYSMPVDRVKSIIQTHISKGQ